jgi:hypothetical protein
MSDEFNFDGKPTGSRGVNAPMPIWDMLSILVLILTGGLVLYFALIFFNPQSSLNILPPGGRGPQIPTTTPTPLQLEATWTPSPTLFVTATNTPRPTFTPIATNTPFSLVPPTKTPKPTSTPKAPFSATQTLTDSTLIHPEISCQNWAGIGGTVVDASNSPVIGVVVVLRGTLNGENVDKQTVSGINKEYGASGFEFVIGNAPAESKKTLYVQLVDQSSLPLSDQIFVTTSSDCAKNLVLVRFKKNR